MSMNSNTTGNTGNGSNLGGMSLAEASLSGPQKAVLFILSLDEEVAGPIVSELGVVELKRLREVAAGMSGVSASALDETFRDFISQSDEAVAVPRGGLPYLRRLATGALGAVRAGEVFAERAATPIERLEAAPPDALAALLADESPQLIGAVLGRLDAQTAAAVVSLLPAERDADVLSRLARMHELPAGALEDVARAIADELPDAAGDSVIHVDGVALAAGILKELGRDRTADIVERIEADHPDLARDMQMALFTFEELKDLDQRAMRTLLREVATDQLTIALKGSSEEVMRAVLNGLSERAAKLIKDDLEVLGKVRKSEVETAQQEIVQVALRLEGEGQIDLGRGDE